MNYRFKDFLVNNCTEDEYIQKKYSSKYLLDKEENEYKVRSIRPCGRYIFSQLDIKDYCFPGYYCRANELQEAQVSCVVNCDKDVLVKLLAEYREPHDCFGCDSILQYIYLKLGFKGLIEELKKYGFEGSFVMDVGNNNLMCGNIGKTSYLYYGYDKDEKIMFSDNKESIMEKTPDNSYNVAMPDSYYDGKKFCSIGEKYGPFALMDDPINARSKVEMRKLRESIKMFLMDGNLNLSEVHGNGHFLLGAMNKIFTTNNAKYIYMINCLNQSKLTELWEEKFKSNKIVTEDLVLPYLYDNYGMKYTINLLNENGIDCSFVIMNNENGLLSAGKSGKGNLYYSYNADGNVSFGSEEIFLSNFKNKTIKMEDEFYDKGEFYKMNEELKESKKESNDKKEKVENRKDVYESLLKEMPNFINEILNGMVSDEIRDKIKKILEDYLAGDEFKNKINDSINGKIDTELKKEILKIVRDEIKTLGSKPRVQEKNEKSLNNLANNSQKEVSVPSVHILNSHGEEIGKTVPEHFHEKFEEILSLVNLDEPVMLIGPAGSGKNYSIAQVSKALNKQMYYTNNASNEFKLTGFIDAGGNYRDTEFYKAFKNGGVFFLDEIDNSDPSALIVINSALANGYMAFPHETIDRHPDFRMVAAANTWGKGSDFQYVGRNALDASTLDRFDNVFFDYDMSLEEELYPSDNVLNFMWAFREAVEKSRIPHIVSTRCIGKVYKKEINGFSPETILRVNVIRNLSQDDLNTILGNMDNLKNNKYYDTCRKLTIR